MLLQLEAIGVEYHGVKIWKRTEPTITSKRIKGTINEASF
jgi:hypothetical protein